MVEGGFAAFVGGVEEEGRIRGGGEDVFDDGDVAALGGEVEG